MVYKQFISKLSLETRALSLLFVFGIFLKLAISFNFSSNFSSNYFLPFIEFFIYSGFSNPYEEYAYQSIEVFPYPALMLFILSGPKILFTWAGSNIGLSLLALKLPLLIADTVIFYILKSWLNHRKTLKLLLLYWFSPVLIYISYIHGQLDSIPIALLFVSLFLLFRNSLNASAIFLAFAMATKTVIAAIIPVLIIFLISQRLSIYQISKFMVITFISFVIINSPYLFSDAFISMVFNNQKQGEILVSSIDFGEVSLYILPIAYCGVLLKGLSFKTISKDIFVMFLGFCFAMLLIFTDPSAGWYFWLLPFLFYFYVKSSSRGFLLVSLLQLAYILYFMFQENNDFLISSNGLVGLISPDLINYVFKIFPVEQNILINLTFTFMQVLLIFNCYWIYMHGLNKYSQHKITSVPLLIGIGGDSGSGKTTLSDSLADVFSKNKSTQLHGDDSHKWERGNDNWAHHTHLDPKAK